MTDPIRVTVWGENVHEGRDESVRKIYPDTMHETIAAALRAKLGADVAVRAQREEPGLRVVRAQDGDARAVGPGLVPAVVVAGDQELSPAERGRQVE